MINNIVENQFRGSALVGQDEMNADDIVSALSRCKYLVCLTSGFYGLQLSDEENSWIIHDFSSTIPNIVSDNRDKFNFKYCGFNVVGEKTTLFIVFTDVNGKYHYAYMNDESHDPVYGFKEIDLLVTDQLVVSPWDVFNKVDSLKQLGSASIALTDYGFWDIEPNETTSKVYSYQG